MLLTAQEIENKIKAELYCYVINTDIREAGTGFNVSISNDLGVELDGFVDSHEALDELIEDFHWEMVSEEEMFGMAQ